ncbi:hypothetical protein D3C73_1532970 [compost metagenome]
MGLKPVTERAFELADSGRFRTPSQITRALIHEGYTRLDTSGLAGKATWRQLRSRCVANRQVFEN